MLSETGIKQITFGGHDFILDVAGTLYWPSLKTLIFSDLHLEKGSYFAERHQLIPFYDTSDTLHRIEKLIQHYQPQRVICLGDNMHDGKAISRMRAADMNLLNSISQQFPEWIWIIGNHDKGHSTDSVLASIKFAEILTLENITFTHDFLPETSLQIAGHYHPKFSLMISANHISGKCFVVSADKIIMPAFGSFTGGMNVENIVFPKILGTDRFKCYLINDRNIWRVK